MIKTWVTLALLCAIVQARAQSSLQETIASGGDYFSSPGGSLSWTLGEALTETYQQGTGYFTQGFQQPQPAPITGLKETILAEHFSIYPNPAKDFLTLDFNNQAEAEYLIELFDMQGRKLISKPLQINSSQPRYQLNMQDYTAAVYLLRVHSLNLHTDYSFRIIKIN